LQILVYSIKIIIFYVVGLLPTTGKFCFIVVGQKDQQRGNNYIPFPNWSLGTRLDARFMQISRKRRGISS